MKSNETEEMRLWLPTHGLDRYIAVKRHEHPNLHTAHVTLRWYRIGIMDRKHNLSRRQWHRRWQRSRDFEMQRVFGWCGAEDGVGERYDGMKKYRYTNQRFNRGRVRAMRLYCRIYAAYFHLLLAAYDKTRHLGLKTSSASTAMAKAYNDAIGAKLT